MLNKIKQNNFGATLMEILVAVALFSVTILSATQIFKMVVDGQRNAIAAQNTQESIRYALEVMAKEIRMAQRTSTVASPPECGIIKGVVYYTVLGNDLEFKNIHDQCVEYYLENDAAGVGRLTIERDGIKEYITPDEIEVSNLEFKIIDDVGDKQSLVTMKMDIQAKTVKTIHQSKMTIQTTISSRYYE